MIRNSRHKSLLSTITTVLSTSLSLVSSFKSAKWFNSNDGTSEGRDNSFPKFKRGDNAIEEASLNTLRIDRSVITLREVSDKYSSSGIFVNGSKDPCVPIDCPSGIFSNGLLLIATTTTTTTTT